MENSPRTEGASFAARIALPSALAIVLFIGATFLYIIPSFERNMMDRKRETIRELNNSVHSLLSKFHEEERRGTLTREAAQKRAADAVRTLRYGPEGKDYFWITDLAPKMIVHPYRPDLDGKSLSDFKDSHGKLLFVEFAEIGRRDGAGYSDYMWQWKDDPGRVVPKLSHVRLFEPWGWVAGTGIYVEDVREEIERLESGLIKISLLIAGIIAVILLYVNHQSLRIEKSRRQAERKLAESEEKYRKLVEAAAEGILMVLEGRITYSNKTAQEMLALPPQKLDGLSFSDILQPGSSASAEYISELLESGGEPPRVEASLLVSGGGQFRALLTASGMVFGGKKGFILSVRDIDRHKETEEALAASREKFRALTDSIDLGVLRASLGSGVTEANPAAVRMLGFLTLEELKAAGSGPLEQLGVPRLLGSAGEGGVREAPVSLRSGEASRDLLLSVLPASDEDGGEKTFDCLLEDVTARRRSEAEREQLLEDLQKSAGSLNQSVRSVAKKAPECPLASPVAKAAAIMTAAGSSAVLVETGGEVVGILTDHDLRSRVLSGGLAPDTPVSRVMTSPLISLPESALLFEAVSLMQERGIRHLAVRGDAGRVVGVIDERELLALKWYSPAVIMEEFSKAQTVAEVLAVKARLPRLVKTLTDSGAASGGVTRLISSAADAAAAKFVEFALRELGAPPVPFAFMALGSQARREQTLVTDQDNALVYDDPPAGSEKECSAYFSALGGKVCAWLDAAGYPFCKGGAMASNPKWCRPVSDWRRYFDEWAALTDPQALLDVNVFFDFRLAAGEKELESRLRAHVLHAVKDKRIFFLNLANNALAFKVPLGFRNSLALEGDGPDAGTFDSKGLLRVFTDFARIYALRAGLSELETASRLAALAGANVLDQAEKASYLQALDAIARLRLRRQAAAASAGAAPDNRIKPSELSGADAQALREAAASASEAINKLRDLVKFLIV